MKLDALLSGAFLCANVTAVGAAEPVTSGDEIDYMGRGFAPVESITELSRFLAPLTPQTGKVDGPGAPDFHDDLGSTTMVHVLGRVFDGLETGALFLQRKTPQGTNRKELYFTKGVLMQVASTDASELLGKYLVRKGKLHADELELALAVLPRYDGRLGDTLISLGLVDAVDIFQAIRDQGRDRVAMPDAA